MSITLTELALLLFFLLLLIAAWRIVELRERSSQLATEVQRQAAELAELQEAARTLEAELRGFRELAERASTSSEEYFRRLVRDAAQMLGQLPALREELNRVRDSLSVAQQELAAYRVSEGEGVTQQLVQLTERNASLQSRVNNLQGQVRNLQRRREGGLDYPPCWADRSGRPEYLFAIRISGAGLSVTPTWPAHRAREALEIDGVSQLANTSLSMASFRERALPILRWSQAQDPECRHFVTVTDAPDMSKEAFKAQLLLVEGFFYKYLSRN